jgi:YfiH family protein
MTPEYLDFRFPGLDNIRCVFTTRGGGRSAGPWAGGNLSLEVGDADDDVRANRAALRDALGVRAWQELRQVHGQDMHMDPEGDFSGGPRLDGDGLATHRPRHALVIKTADCQALLMADASGRHVAALHCGWRGNVVNFPGNGVRAFCDRYGLTPGEIMVVRGPSLGPGKSEFINFETEWGPAYAPYFNQATRCMDLWSLTRDQLLDAGVPAAGIFSLDICTASSPQFFSYRRDRITGRQAGIIWIEESPAGS